MPIIRKEKLWENLKNGDISNVYLLCGAETLLRDVATAHIVSNAFSAEDFRDFNETTFSLNQPDGLTAALSAAEQLPMMSARRLIRITDVRVSSGGRLDTLKDDDENRLRVFLDDPPPHAVVIFIADELNGSRKLTKILKDKCICVEFEPLDSAGLRKWITAEVGKLGSEIDQRSLDYLITVVDTDLHRLSNEIAKLSAAALPDKRITIELIDNLVANTRELGNWDLINHLKAGRKADTMTALNKMLDDGAEPLMILGQIASSYRRTVLEGRSDAEKMSKRLQLIADSDVAMKTSVGSGGPFGMRMHLEKLACELLLI